MLCCAASITCAIEDTTSVERAPPVSSGVPVAADLAHNGAKREPDMAWRHGHFTWNELMTRDVERAKSFYAQSIGWTFEPAPGPAGIYWIAKSGEERVAGLFTLISPAFDGVPEGWMAYLAVDFVDARVHQAQLLGARLMRPIFDVPHVGRIAILREPGGAALGWITPVKV